MIRICVFASLVRFVFLSRVHRHRVRFGAPNPFRSGDEILYSESSCVVRLLGVCECSHFIIGTTFISFILLFIIFAFYARRKRQEIGADAVLDVTSRRSRWEMRKNNVFAFFMITFEHWANSHDKFQVLNLMLNYKKESYISEERGRERERARAYTHTKRLMEKLIHIPPTST